MDNNRPEVKPFAPLKKKLPPLSTFLKECEGYGGEYCGEWILRNESFCPKCEEKMEEENNDYLNLEDFTSSDNEL